MSLGRLSEQHNLGLLEVASSVFVNEDKREVVARRELLVDFAERRRQIEAAEEEADWDRLAAGG